MVIKIKYITYYNIEMKISVIGGVDTGKSSLISRILIETDIFNNRDINKSQKEAESLKKPNQWLPNLVDTNPNEKEKGITLEPSQEVFTYKDKSHTLINNPGHISLTNTMIKASSKSDISILVVSANQKELTKCLDQGFEHALICRILGINTLIVCINKAEFIDSNNKYETIINTIKHHLKKLRFEKIIFCAVSAKLSKNIKNHDYKFVDMSLLDIINELKIPKRDTKCIKPFENIIKVKLIFHKIPKIISPGFKCLLHSFDKAYTVEFNNIENDDLNFVTDINSKSKLIDCHLYISTNDFLDTSTMLRKDNSTIAYGYIYK